MADVDGTVYNFPSGPETGDVIVKHYLMQWRDVDCGPVTYRSWHVTDAPDPTGVFYAGPKCGVTPITGAFVTATWTVIN